MDEPKFTSLQLVIDIGNTRIKAARFEGERLLHTVVFGQMKDLLQSDFLTAKADAAIICSVVDDFLELIQAIEKNCPVLVFSAQTPVPVTNLYQSAATLGSDRLAAAVGGALLAPGNPVLVIDAGTCIKYNVVNEKGEYLGGAISPGLTMRLKAMHHFTDRLPLLELESEFNEFIGRNTIGSMLSGALFGAVNELEGFVAEYEGRFNNLKVFLTGGDADFLAKRIKKPIFADQYLILKGLNKILSHNR